MNESVCLTCGVPFTLPQTALCSFQENCKWGFDNEIFEYLFRIRLRNRSEVVMVKFYANAWQTFVGAYCAAYPKKIITSQQLYFVHQYRTYGICFDYRTNSHRFDESGRQAALFPLIHTHTYLAPHVTAVLIVHVNITRSL